MFKAFVVALPPDLGEPLGPIVHVGSCKDSSMSVGGCGTIGEDERGVKGLMENYECQILLWLWRAYLMEDQHNFSVRAVWPWSYPDTTV